MTASVGLALAHHRDTSPERLLSDADSAMYRAKERGRATIEMYDEDKDVWSIGRLQVGNDLHRAISRDEFDCTTSPWWTSVPRVWWPSRRWCGGDIRPGACCLRASSSNWPRTPG